MNPTVSLRAGRVGLPAAPLDNHCFGLFLQSAPKTFIMLGRHVVFNLCVAVGRNPIESFLVSRRWRRLAVTTAARSALCFEAIAPGKANKSHP